MVDLVELALKASSSQVPELVSAVESMSRSNLVIKLRESLSSDEAASTASLVRALFLGSPADGDGASSERRRVIVSNIIEMLDARLVTGKKASEVTNVVLVHLESFSSGDLTVFVNELITHWEQQSQSDGESAQIFSKCLALLSRFETVPISFGEGIEAPDVIDIDEYRTRIINRLVGFTWLPRTASSLTAELRHVPLSSSQLHLLLNKVISMFSNIDMVELPAICYQLLLLSSRGHRAMVLRAIQAHFDKLIDRDMTKLRHVEGTLLMHVYLAASQDDSLSREIIKGTSLLSPFSVALLLTVGQLSRHEEQVQGVLYTAVLTKFKTVGHVDEYLLQCAANSRCGWDHLVPGLVQLGLLLMDSPCDRGTIDGGKAVVAFSKALLVTVFKHQRDIRARVLDSVMERLMAGSVVPRAVSLLNGLVWSDGDVIDTHALKLREALDFLPHIPPSSATELLLSILPAARASPRFMDSVVIVLRKSLFSKGVQSRCVALGGLVCLLVTMEHSEAMRLEILGFLRRCLSQQSVIKSDLYAGLYRIIEAQESLETPAADILTNQLSLYVSDTGINIDACVDESNEPDFTVEPIGDLVLWSERVLRLLQGRHDDVTPVMQRLATLIDRLAKTLSLDRLNLGRDTDFSTVAKLGRVNAVKATMVIGVIEGLMEYDVLSTADSNVSILYESYDTLTRALSDGDKKTKSKHATSASFAYTSTLFQSLCDRQNPPPSLLTHALTLINYQLVNMCEGIVPMDSVPPLLLSADAADVRDGEMKERGHVFIMSIAPLLWTAGTSKDMVLSALEGWEHCVRYMLMDGDQDKLANLFDTCQLPGTAAAKSAASVTMAQEPATGTSTLSTSSPALRTIDIHCRMLESMTFERFCEEGKHQHAECLLRVIDGIVTTHLTKRDHAITASLKWCKQFCMEKPLPHIALVRSLTTLLLRMSRLAGDKGTRTMLCNDVKIVLGDVSVDDEEEVDDAVKCVVVNDRTASTILNVIVSSMDVEMDATDQQIDELNDKITVFNTEKDTVHSQQLDASNRDVGNGLDAVITSIATLTSQVEVLSAARISDARDLEAFHKVITRYYNKGLLTLTKILISLDKVPPMAFVQLVATIAQSVTPCLYAVMTASLGQEDNMTSARIGRQGRVIPNLIFAIEQFERFLIKLGRQTNTNLKRYMHRSTARDFRIDEGLLEKAMEESGGKKKRDDKDDDSDDSDDETVKKKKKIK